MTTSGLSNLKELDFALSAINNNKEAAANVIFSDNLDSSGCIQTIEQRADESFCSWLWNLIYYIGNCFSKRANETVTTKWVHQAVVKIAGDDISKTAEVFRKILAAVDKRDFNTMLSNLRSNAVALKQFVGESSPEGERLTKLIEAIDASRKTSQTPQATPKSIKIIDDRFSK